MKKPYDLDRYLRGDERLPDPELHQLKVTVGDVLWAIAVVSIFCFLGWAVVKLCQVTTWRM
jgi:hypothetical protein